MKIDNFQLVLDANAELEISRDDGRSIKLESSQGNHSEDGDAIGDFDLEDDP